MRLVSIKQGRDFNYDTTHLFIFDTEEDATKEPIYVLRAVESLSGKDMLVAKSFNREEVADKMRDILSAYESNNRKVFCID